MGIVLKGGTIVSSKDSYIADIRIENGIIKAMGENLEVDGDEVINVSGRYILPGGIDAHTHFDLDVGVTRTADNFETGTKAALVGGTTTIIDYANHIKGQRFLDDLRYYSTLTDGRCYCDYSYHLSITEWNQDFSKEMGEMVLRGIPSFKMYMAYKGTLQVEDYEIEEALRKAKELGIILSFHCEDGDEIVKNVSNLLLEGKTEPKFHEISRGDEVELAAVKRILDISEKVDYPVYIVHLSTKKALDEIIRRRKSGTKVIIETCPQYLLLNKEAYKGKVDDDFNGAKYVMSPPLRSKEDNNALWKGIANRDIQILATDHCSFNYKNQKEIGLKDFSKIPNGAPGVEHRMILLYSFGVREERISINKLVEITSENPSKIFGLYPNKGVIAEGSDGDILVLNPSEEEVITWQNQTQNVDYTPYEGYKVKGKIERVFLRGKEVVKDGKLLSDKAFGQFVSRKRLRDEVQKYGEI